jgi:DNA primase
MIKEKTVQEILETAKVEEVVQEFVNLKRRGSNLIGLCPFHSEKTPSFSVSPSKNIYKCFGCGRGGNAVQFLMEHENLTFPEALRYLAKKYGIEIEETEVSQEAIQERQRLDSFYIVNQFAKDFFQDNLFNTDKGRSVGLNYFKERGFREETIRKFGLGFAPDETDALMRKAQTEGYNIDLLKELGLATKYDRDFFRNRVMFAIHNLSGKVIGFGGRILVKDAKAPKYINTPETEVYTKSKVLYGAFFAKNAIRKEDECILVEGYTDVLSLHQAGIENVAASSGTSLTVEQIRLIKRYTPNVKIIYDGDYAGIKAALRGLDLVLEQDLNVKVVLLPQGEDPDSYLQKVGVSAFKEYITQSAQDFIMFKADLLLKDAAHDPVKKSQVIKDIVSSISRIPDPLKRSLYVKECARIVEVDEQILVNETNKIVGEDLRKRQHRKETAVGDVTPGNEELSIGEEPSQKDVLLDKPAAPRLTGDEFQEKDVARILITGGGEIFDKEEGITVAEHVLANIEDVLQDFDNKLYQKVAEETLQLLIEKRKVTPHFFIQHPDSEISRLAIDLVSSPYEYSENWEKMWDITLQTQKKPEENFTKDGDLALKQFKLRKIMRMCEKAKKQIEEYQNAGDFEQAVTYMKVKKKLDDMRNELAAELGAVVLK